jgi:hypothetical protein
MQWQKWDTTTEINAEQLKRCGPPRWRTMMQSAQSHKLEPGQTGTGNDWCIYIYKVYTWPIYLSIQPSIYQSICSSNPIQSTCLDYGQHRFKHPSMTISLDIYIYNYLDMPFEISCMMLKIVMMNDYSVDWRASYFQTSWSEDCFEDALMIDLHDWSDSHRPIIDCETYTWLEWLGFKHK